MIAAPGAIMEGTTIAPAPLATAGGATPGGMFLMHDQPTDDLDDGFGHWLAGFADGEGCFSIVNLQSQTRARHGLNARFQISLRADDRPILEAIQYRTGLGTVTDHRAECRGGRVNNPSALWGVWSRSDCVRLVQIFDKYPLRAKKARDYAIWREAVIEWNAITYQPRKNRGPSRDWTRLLMLRDLLMTSRRFENECEAIPAVLDATDQLSLEYP